MFLLYYEDPDLLKRPTQFLGTFANAENAKSQVLCATGIDWRVLNPSKHYPEDFGDATPDNGMCLQQPGGGCYYIWEFREELSTTTKNAIWHAGQVIVNLGDFIDNPRSDTVKSVFGLLTEAHKALAELEGALGKEVEVPA